MRYIFFLLALFFTNLEAKNQPNFVLILIDDLGLTDLEAFGGEIDTPNINSLAEKGLMFTNYHTSPECAPSRAMLLTGMDNHKTGIPMIPEVLPRNLRKNKGYEGYLLPEALTIAEVLKKSGYRTYMTGKWHLGFGGEHIPSLPINRGFDKTFILDATGGDNYSNHSYLPYYLEAPWFKNGEEIELPEDFYSSEFFIDQMIDFIDEDGSKSPFFAYVSFQAQHIPVQAPKEFTEKYLDLYKDGWSALRERRLKRAQKLGIFPEDKNAVNSLENYPWEEETQEEKELLIKSMAVFAGMLNAMDFHIGRLIEYLKNNGLYEDTIFIITSDNGPEGNDPRDHATWRAWYETSRWNNNLETLGEEDSYVFIGTEFAQAMASPSHLYKFHMSEGGLRVPLIISGDKAFQARAILEKLPMDVKIIEGPVGRASTIKMVRSIMVKGLEALTAECALAAVEADVLDEVFNSLSAEHPHFDIIKHSIYNFERSISHGKRRSEELKEVSKMLEDLKLANHMSKATAVWQNKIGSLEKTNSISKIKENYVSFAKQLSSELRDIKE